MKILFDSQAFNMQNYGGVTRYFTELYYELKHNDETKDSLISVIETNNKYLQLLGWPSEKDFQLAFQNKSFNDSNKANLIYSYLTYVKHNYDILHTTFYYEYLPQTPNHKVNTKNVITIHDMIPEKYNWENGNNIQIINKHYMAFNSDAIICPSYATKTDIANYMPDLDMSKVHVIHHGYRKQTIQYNNIINEPYILYVGGRMHYKKFNEFLSESVEFLNNHNDFKIICTGDVFNEEELLYIDSLGISNKVGIIIASDEDMANLYHYAFCFVFSSEYEGFGLPILEAWGNECITLLNDIPVFREIAGKTSKYFNINEKGSLNNELEKIYKMTSAKRELHIYKQNKALQQYTWKKCADEHIKVYKSILQ